ncbi:hypothetical protein Lal_00008502 [Lupinus albus]|nr:hypothetical protein Lal_00008502 [Lupinus albus]
MCACQEEHFGKLSLYVMVLMRTTCANKSLKIINKSTCLSLPIEKSTPREFKSKKAYIVWDVPEEETTSSTSSEEESAKLCLMVRSDNDGNSDSHEDNNEVYSDTSSTSDDLPSYEVLYNAYVELHEELKKLARINVDKKREILRNEKKLSQLQKELDELKLENETLDLIYS